MPSRDSRSIQKSSESLGMENATADVSRAPFFPRAALRNGKNVRMVPGMTDLIAIIEVVDVRRVEIDGLLHETQTQKAHVKVTLRWGSLARVVI